MAYSSSDTSGSGSGRSRSLKRETHIFSHHVVSYKDRASGAEGSAEVCGLFKCGTDLIFECNEMTTVTRGAMGADLGSATA